MPSETSGVRIVGHKESSVGGECFLLGAQGCRKRPSVLSYRVDQRPIGEGTLFRCKIPQEIHVFVPKREWATIQQRRRVGPGETDQ